MCFSQPNKAPPPPPTPAPAPPVQAPLAPELPGDSNSVDNVRGAATARRSLRIDLAPKAAGRGLSIPM
jgi:U5 snRNP spliceosome subunit